MSQTDLITTTEDEEFDDMGSYNHSLVQGNLAYLLRQAGNYSVFIELSLDTSPLEKQEFPNIANEAASVGRSPSYHATTRSRIRQARPFIDQAFENADNPFTRQWAILSRQVFFDQRLGFSTVYRPQFSRKYSA